MFIIDLLFAFIVAIIFSSTLSVIFRSDDKSEIGLSFFLIFLIILGLTWTIGIWITPFGPSLLGSFWLPFVFVGFLIFLLIAAIIPANRNSSPKIKMKRTDEVKNSQSIKDKNDIKLILSILFIVLIFAIIMHYALK